MLFTRFRPPWMDVGQLFLAFCMLYKFATAAVANASETTQHQLGLKAGEVFANPYTEMLY